MEPDKDSCSHILSNIQINATLTCILKPRYPEEKDENGRTLYGGVRDGVLVGGTKVRRNSLSSISSQERDIFVLEFHLDFLHYISSGVSGLRFPKHPNWDG